MNLRNTNTVLLYELKSLCHMKLPTFIDTYRYYIIILDTYTRAITSTVDSIIQIWVGHTSDTVRIRTWVYRIRTPRYLLNNKIKYNFKITIISIFI